MDVNITTIANLRVLIIGIGSTIILMVVEAHGLVLMLPVTKNSTPDTVVDASDIRRENHHLG